MAAPAAADDFGIRLDQRHQHRAFWLSQSWTDARRETMAKAVQPKFTTTYTEGIAQRFGIGPGGHADLFQRNLGLGSGPSAPALVVTIYNGAASVALRWHPGE